MTGAVDSLFGDYPDREGQIEHVEKLPERPPRTGPADGLLPEPILSRLNVDLYTHQVAALEALSKDRDVCISTSTSSGKTLVYGLEIARRAIQSPESTALLIYPTKALSSDQKTELDDLFSRLGLDLNVGVYDGDASASRKKSVRRKADVVITNFAGLNQYLPHHEKWDRILRNLKTVVVEEAHAYSGVFGMHVAWILRRLLRIVESERYAARPRFIVTSATIGNPGDHAGRLLGREVEVVDEDGSPRGEREVVFWNPPKFDEAAAVRKSTHRESSRLLAHLIDRGLRTLMFAPSRKMTELDTRWARKRLDKTYGDGHAKVESYHAGHLKEERREVEDRLKNGDLDGVVSTTALELGINIGHVDATVLSGYPGSRQSFWQQIGRAGRDASSAVNVLVAHENALDQYIMRNPGYLTSEDVENAVVDLENNTVYLEHVTVAAKEMPLTRYDTAYFDDRLPRAVDLLKKQNIVSGDLDAKVYFVGEGRPEAEIHLYGVGSGSFEVRLHREDGSTRTLDRSVSRSRAFRDFHPGAIYIHKGDQFRVETFDADASEPSVELKQVDVDYYTQSSRKPEIQEVTSRESTELGPYKLDWGSGIVNEYYPHYKKKDLKTQSIKETLPTGLDEPVRLNTKLFWLTLPEEMATEIRDHYVFPDAPGSNAPNKDPFLGGIHAVEHALIQMAPTELLISSRDLGGLSVNVHPETGRPTVFVYDGVKGGLGFTKAMYRKLNTLCERAEKLIAACDCEGVGGCPSCVMDAQCGNNNQPLHTRAALHILRKVPTEVSKGES